MQINVSNPKRVQAKMAGWSTQLVLIVTDVDDTEIVIMVSWKMVISLLRQVGQRFSCNCRASGVGPYFSVTSTKGDQ